MAKHLLSIDQPQLPIPPEVYDVQYQNKLNNVQRLFYNRLSNNMNALVGTNGGQYVECPNGLFYNTVQQTFALPNTAYPVVYNQTYLGSGITLANSSKITIGVPGVYSFNYSGQLLSSSGSAKNFYLWIARNGTNISYSTHTYTLSANSQYLVITWGFNIDLQTGDYIQLMAEVDNVDLKLAVTTAGVHPGGASSVLAVNYSSMLPNTLPTLP